MARFTRIVIISIGRYYVHMHNTSVHYIPNTVKLVVVAGNFMSLEMVLKARLFHLRSDIVHVSVGDETDTILIE